MNMLALLFLCKRKDYFMAESITDEQLKHYIDIFKTNRENDPHSERWNETINSNYLIEFFEYNSIFFKEFLKSVIVDNVYCEDDENDLKIDIKDLDFNDIKIYKQYKGIPTDICVEGNNFICVIENKFKSDSHNRKNGYFQCLEYKKQILELTDKKYKMFIRLDNEHCRLKINDEDFKNNKEWFAGYYNAWFGKNILKSFKEIFNNTDIELDSKIREKLKIYCNFLEETTLEYKSEIFNKIHETGKFLAYYLRAKSIDAKYDLYNTVVKINNSQILIYPDEFLNLSLLKLDDEKQIQNFIIELLKQKGIE